jgi:hypothetical protein
MKKRNATKIRVETAASATALKANTPSCGYGTYVELDVGTRGEIGDRPRFPLSLLNRIKSWSVPYFSYFSIFAPETDTLV